MSVATPKDINPQTVPSKSFESARAFIERRAVLTYFVLVFIISWGVGLIVVGPGGFPLSWEKFETVGTLVFMASLTGPCLAGIVLTGLIGGRAGFRDFFSRLFKWRVGARWYVVALLTAPLLTMAIVKTSTGFAPRGATIEDVALMRRTVGRRLGVKASGGIKTLALAMSLIHVGADLIGTSSTDAILEEASGQEAQPHRVAA